MKKCHHWSFGKSKSKGYIITIKMAKIKKTGHTKHQQGCGEPELLYTANWMQNGRKTLENSFVD